MTALDIAQLLFSPSALVRVRARLTALSGGDFVDDQYLYRLRLTNVPRGNPERIYTLGAKGRDFLENVLGVPVAWQFRPSRVKHFGFNVIMRNVVLTRVLVAATVSRSRRLISGWSQAVNTRGFSALRLL